MNWPVRGFILVASILPSVVLARDLPDPRLTPGDTLPVTAQQVCSPGYAKSVRHVLRSVREQVFASYSLPGGNHTGYCAKGCELDHLVSLELGGSNDPKNLWPEPYLGTWGARVKDKVEDRLHAMVCIGKITLEAAQREIAANWKAAYRKYVGASH